MRVRRLTTLAAILLTAGLVAADAPGNWKNYFEGPAGYLLTKKEKKDWKKVDSAAEAERFIDLFWAKRDPNPETPLNEFKEDFDLRVKSADESFSWEKNRGSMTERGEVLILLGRPVQRIEKTPEAQGPGVGSRGGDTGIENPGFTPEGGTGTMGGEPPSGATGPMAGAPPSTSQLEAARQRGAIEAWVYDPRSLPVNIKQDQPMLVIFQETRLGSGDYRLVKESPRNTLAQRVLGAAPDALLLHPDLTEIPRYGLIQGTQPATDAQLAWFGQEGGQAIAKPASVLTKEGLVSGPRHFIWTHLELPDGPKTAVAVGRLRDAATGDQVGTFQLDVNAVDTPAGEGYELSVPVAPGEWALDVALAGDGGPLAATSVDLQTTDVPLDKTVFAPFLWGAQVVQLTDPKISDPFSMGGWHVVPRSNDTYTTKETLNYMTYVLQPKLGADRQPQFTFRVSLFQGARRLVQSPPQPAQLSQVAPDMWLYGGGIDLAKIPQPGDYSLEVQLTQTSDSAEATVKIPFTLVKADAEPGASTEGDAQQ